MVKIRLFRFSAVLMSVVFLSGCNPIASRFISKFLTDIPHSIDSVANKIQHPVFPHVGLSVLWVGHATCLIQIGDKIFITDPIFTRTAGIVSKRIIEPGILPSSITSLDYILISHLHFDHFSYSSLDMLPKSATLILPSGGAEYTPDLGFSEYREMQPWASFSIGGVRITAVPVKHFNGRYGFEAAWTERDTYTGYVIEYQGKTIFFAGDTGYDPEKFIEIGKHFNIDLALIPIAPIEPRDFMRRVHADPKEALQIFKDVQAMTMIPIHHRTFVQGFDSSLTFAQDQLKNLVAEQHLESRVFILNIGEQRILTP